MNQQLRRLKHKHEKVLLYSVYKQYRDKYYEEFKMTDLQFELVWNFFVTHADKREMNLSKECIGFIVKFESYIKLFLFILF
jgi:hypothetical protein